MFREVHFREPDFWGIEGHFYVISVTSTCRFDYGAPLIW